MNVAEANAYAKKTLAKINAAHESKFIMQAVLNLSLEELMLYSSKIITEEEKQEFLKLLANRLSGKPLQYLLGKWEFMGLPFITTQNVLIPRQDTEILVEQAINFIQQNNYKTALDLCTGSGCIATSIAKLSDIQEVIATDISPFALSLAKQNVDLNQVHEKVAIKKSDMFKNLVSPIDNKIKQKFDLIISNPPYIPREDIKNLDFEVKNYEPVLALDGGKDGLDFYWIIASESVKHINMGGTVIVEIGQNQHIQVKKLFEAAGYSDINLYKDLNNIYRVVSGTLK